MPRYHELILNPGHPQQRQNHRFDLLRQIEAKTGRPVVVYAANLGIQNAPNSLNHEDLTPFSDLTRTLGKKESVDVLINSPGGLAEAAERIVGLLRARFKSVRFIVPREAFSAATMLAMSGDALLLDDTSALGPIDPQIVTRDPNTGQSTAVPAEAIMSGFKNAKDAILKEPSALGVYLPLLNRMDLALFEICKNADTLAKTLVHKWLKTYLLKDEEKPDERATEITKYLSSHKDRLSHGRPLTIDVMKDELKIKAIIDLRDDQPLRDLIGELWDEIQWYLETSQSSKFYENAYGVAFSRKVQVQQQVIAMPFPGMPQLPPGFPGFPFPQQPQPPQKPPNPG